MTIVRLRRQPLQRVKSWLHIKSSQFALAKAIQTHVASFMLLLIVALQFFDPEGLEQVVSNGLFGFPIDSLLYANAVASLLAALAAPAFYMMQWLRLRRKYSFEFCIFKDLAQTDPAQRLEAQATDDGYPEPADSDKPYAMGDCFAVLGVAESASIEEVRKAYKKLMRQTHPDRVYDLSPALRKLAESETKTINAAYRQALASLPLHWGPSSGRTRLLWLKSKSFLRLWEDLQYREAWLAYRRCVARLQLSFVWPQIGGHGSPRWVNRGVSRLW
jgi:DnaJ-domain-containing protein 1